MQKLETLAAEGKINQNASIRDKQAVIINAPVEKVWSLMVDAKNWSKWNNEIHDVKIDEVKEGETFTWSLKGSKKKTKIARVIKHELIAWVSTFRGIKVARVWKLDETDGNQTIVTCEESMQGLLTIIFGHQNLHESMLHWLEALKKEAEKS
ncbi:SRPBCC domain-containing protein [Marinoscillum sp. MHG1-6]|uniref:SRPBCC domain-containing protein n=1 Tax=Marinoscillum sp. MHG1-6 TaxID=2959627 RepID=UPI002157E914|nr:SRPBCC domain-containing protein [Marinoscillum sp. MHG1-6]